MKYKKNTWISMQVGLLEAAWNLMRNNQHVHIYTSIRLEAYMNYRSENKMAMRGNIVVLEYTKSELRMMLDKLSVGYTGKKFEDFIGVENFSHPNLRYEVNSFDYILMHTISRPRDIITMLTDYRKPTKQDEIIPYLGRHTNDIAKSIIAPQIFQEYSLFLHSMKEEEERDVFLSLINRNILSYKELRSICQKYNNYEEVECEEIDGYFYTQ